MEAGIARTRTISRREFLQDCGRTALVAGVSGVAPPWHAWMPGAVAPDHTLRIAPLSLELAPHRVVKTIAYNGVVPGPLLRMREEVPVTIDVVNDTGKPEFVHWHGLKVSAEVDGAMEQGTPAVAPRGRQRYAFTPRPSGTRWYHSHTFAGRDLGRSGYTGQFGFLIVDPARDPARYDQEIFLAMHDWDPYITGSDDGYEMVGYTASSINGRLLGFDDPIRVREGERVLMRVLNASASETHWLALPGHRFTVVALDGNAVPRPAAVDQLRLDPGERVDAVVEMKTPGVWILGEPRDAFRARGLGVVVEYAGRTGSPEWITRAMPEWSYLDFAAESAAGTPVEAERIPLVIRSEFRGHGAFENWSINGRMFPKTETVRLREGTRYRLVLDNRSSEDHPVHLHRHILELVSVGGRPTAGVLKDVLTVPAQSVVEADFTADNPGKSLFHCHLQDHMDFGFMMMFDYGH